MNPVALITGASRGIGRGIALEFAKLGFELAINYAGNLEAARQTSPLPRHPDVGAAERALRAVRAEVARRAVHLVPGPWGTDASSPPEARYDD